MRVSIVIPTFNRALVLAKVLSGLRSQCERVDGEVFVVDDGSSDDTCARVARWAEDFPVPLHLLRQAHRGPASARNLALRHASGDVVLFTGDDILPAPGMIQAHLVHHETHPEPTVAVLGKVTWSPELSITPLMRWLEHGGPQFCYHRIEDPLDVPPTFFWTANVSAKTQLVRAVGGFDERFPTAAFEDVELGVRLARAGMRLHFVPQALGYHYHPVTLRSSLARMERVAMGALVASRSMPEVLKLGDDGPLRRTLRRVVHGRWCRRGLVALGPLCGRIPLVRERYFQLVHQLHYRAAIRRLLREGWCCQSSP